MEKVNHIEVKNKYIERQSISKNNYGMQQTIDSFNQDCPQGDIEWYKLNLNLKSKIINKIHTNLFNTNNMLGISLKDLIKKYKNKELPENHIRIINSIKSNLKEIRIFVFSEKNTIDEYAIYDVWHTAVAFAIKGKDILAHLGVREKFECFKI